MLGVDGGWHARAAADDGRTFLARLVPWGVPGRVAHGYVDDDGNQSRQWVQLRRGCVDLGDRPPVLISDRAYGGVECGSTVALIDKAWGLDGYLRFDESFAGDTAVAMLSRYARLPLSIEFTTEPGDEIRLDGQPTIWEQLRVRLVGVALHPRPVWPQAHVVGRVKTPTNAELAQQLAHGLRPLART